MKKFFVISLIVSLILFTAIIKNSTKRIDDQIFSIRENIRDLNKDLGNIKLEYDYLSSAEKLLEFQTMYFDDELVEKDIQNFKIIDDIENSLNIKKFKFTNE